MADTESSKVGAITLDELIALNDEITALVRAGVPLEPALAELGTDLPGRLGKIATMLAERTGRGESLLQVLSEQAGEMPPVYRAVVEAGLRTGRLPAALEALAGSIRRLAETRRGVATAALYPLLVLIVAWAMFAFFTGSIAPRFLSFFESFDVPRLGMFETLASWGHAAVYWGPLLPLLVVVLAAVWWRSSGRAAVAEPRRSRRLIGWLPWMGRTLQWSHTATFVEVFALLVESRVPLHEGVVLAAEASGDARLVPAAKQLAAALQRGDDLEGFGGDRAGFPPLLSWLMAAGQRHGALLPALKHAAQTYRRRARHQANLVRLFLPVVLTVAIGGSVALLYALTVFLPYSIMLKTLGGP